MGETKVKIYTYRDGRIQNPVIRGINVVGRVISSVGAKLPSLDPDGIEKAAVTQAQSDNFGSSSYREPLEKFVQSFESEASASTFGRMACRNVLISALTNRIRLADWVAKNPEVRQEDIRRPWIIVGMPRTGSSLLSILLGLDPYNRPLLQWEAASPVPPPRLATVAEDPRIAQSAKEFEQLDKLAPALKAMHPFGASLAEECVALLMYDLRTVGLESQFLVPSYGNWLANCDMSPAFDQHRLALQALQAAIPTQSWVLKTPNHLWNLPTLLKYYPDARIIWTHRDPTDVVLSLSSLVNTMHCAFSMRADPKPTANEWRGKMRQAVERGMSFDDSAKAGWCYHLRYDQFLKAPLAEMQNIYAHFDEPLGDLHSRNIQAWMSERHQSVFGRHKYDAADFGWSREEIAEEFRAYSERFLEAK